MSSMREEQEIDALGIARAVRRGSDRQPCRARGLVAASQQANVRKPGVVEVERRKRANLWLVNNYYHRLGRISS